MLLSIDTEFERRHTYRPILSIVQIKEEGKDAVIYDVLKNRDKKENIRYDERTDIKTSVEDIQYLKYLLSNDDNIKIIHACKQDMEAIYYRFNIVMKNIFDTQVAGKYLGFGNEIGYAKLVNLVCHKDIVKEKRLQHSNWLKRPLTGEQIVYAKQDVEFLQPIYNELITMFNDDQTAYQQFQQECKKLEDEKYYKFNPALVWQRYKHKIGYTKNYSLIKQLFFEREKQAYRRNLPREFVCKFEDLVRFAKKNDDV